MNTAIATIFVTVVHLTNGHTAYSGIDAQSPGLCLDAASKGNTQVQLLGWRADPVNQRANITIKQQWNTEIDSIEFTCMSKENYMGIRDTEDTKYWTPIER